MTVYMNVILKCVVCTEFISMYFFHPFQLKIIGSGSQEIIQFFSACIYNIRIVYFNKMLRIVENLKFKQKFVQ